MKTQTKGPFLGINNRLPDFALHVDKVGDYLRDAVNVDITHSGSIVRRSAFAMIQPMTGAHSLYMDSDTTGYLVRASVLYRVTLLPTYAETSTKALAANDRVSYKDFGGSIYFSNGTDSGRIVGSQWFPMAMPTPSAPSVSGNIGGSLYKGGYQVALAYYNAVTGEEGGVGPSSNPVISSATGGLRISLPGAVPGATHINVFVSTVNGSIPLFSASVTVGTSLIDIIDETTRLREANARFEAPLPAGRLFVFNGCLCSYAGNNVYEGIPFRPGYYLPSEGRIPMPAEVSNVVPAENGVYIVADKTYWLSGPVMTKAETVKDVLPYGGSKGTEFIVPTDSHQFGWFGKRGFVLADTMGQVTEAMADNIDLDMPAFGVSSVFLDRGYIRVVACGWCMNLEKLFATRYTDYDFTSISGSYGTKPDGIYDLSSVGRVDSSINLGRENFGSENMKAMPASYLGGFSETPMQLTIESPNGDSWDYLARSCSGGVEINRVDPGLGLRENWFGLTVSNTDGSDFNLASVSFAPVASKRRI